MPEPNTEPDAPQTQAPEQLATQTAAVAEAAQAADTPSTVLISQQARMALIVEFEY
jgi:hypothetical protein